MTTKELKDRQQWPLSQKVFHSMEVISTFIERVGGIDKVYVSFSGGKDSTVLLDIARRVYPNILAVFSQTGNEYPEICRFVRQKIENGENIQIILPKYKPKQVWEKYGFPLISKETAERIEAIRRNPDSKQSKKALGITDPTSHFQLAKKWRFLINENFNCSKKCCQILKKQPFEKYEKETGRFPILGTMAEESILRTTSYVRNGGCNVFGDNRKKKSMPLSIWTEKDIWEYCKTYNIALSPLYEKGAQRSGCIGCGFGIQYKHDTRLTILLNEHPKLYELIMNYTNNGVTFREAARKVLSINGVKLPDE